jgi:hypothetical protein
MSLMKSLLMVARIEVSRRNTPGDWNIKDRTSCTENLHLGREDDIVKIMQVEGAKCIKAWEPTGAKGRPNRAEVGLGRSTQAGRPGPLPTSVRPPFPCTRRIFNPKSLEARPFTKESHSHREAIHKLEREEGDLQRRIDHLEGSTHKWRRKTPSDGWPWSTVPCLAPWWGKLHIRPWVVIGLEDVIVLYWLI